MSKRIIVLSILLITLAASSTNLLAARVEATPSTTNHNLDYISVKNSETLNSAIEAKDDSIKTDKNTKEVPIPSALWLFGSALLGFIKISNRRHL